MIPKIIELLALGPQNLSMGVLMEALANTENGLWSISREPVLFPTERHTTVNWAY